MENNKPKRWFSRFGRKGRTKVSFVSNPNAGKHTRRAGLGTAIGSILHSLPQHTAVYSTETLAQLEVASREIHEQGTDIFALDGGDGSLHATLTKFLQNHEDTPQGELPKILYVPTGTMRIVASSLGLTRHSPKRFAERIVTKIHNGIPFDVVNVDVLRINGEYGFVYGAGLPVHYLNEYYSCGTEGRGPWGAFRVIRKTFWDEVIGLLPFRKSHQILTAPVHGKIILPESHDPPVGKFMSHSGLMISSVDEIGFGCKGMPDAMSHPGKFMVRSTQLGFLGILANIGQLFAGFSLPRTFDATTSRVVVEWEQPTVIQIDGEVKEPRLRDVIECGPRLQFIVG